VKLARRVLGKLVTGLVMIWVVATFTFFLVRKLPGNPVQAEYERLIQGGLSPDQAKAQAAVMFGFQPHTPLAEQYLHYLWRLLHLDFGQSTSYSGVGVGHVVRSAAPWTITLVMTGIIASFLIGVTFGIIAAVRRTSKLGDTLTISGSLLHGVPQFVIALLLAYVFTTLWPVLPFGAPYNVTVEPGWNLAFINSVVVHAILPVSAYALSAYGGWLLTMKSSVVSVLGDDFILAAELRGIKPITRMRYIGRNAILPLFTVLALSIGLLFGGSIFIENIFDYPGLGHLLLQAINKRDYPLMSGAFLMITVAVVIVNILADLFYSVIDPRVRRV